jgi:hypothetical protein
MPVSVCEVTRLMPVAMADLKSVAFLLSTGRAIADPRMRHVSDVVQHQTCVDDTDRDDARHAQQRRELIVRRGGVDGAARSSRDRGSEVMAVPDDVHMPVSSDGREKSHDLMWLQAHAVLMLPTPYGLAP